MIAEQPIVQNLPTTLAEFMVWEPTDAYKYEWNDGELIRFTGMKKKEYYIADLLNLLMFKTGYFEQGALLQETDVMLTGIQMRRPDLAYFTRDQIYAARQGEDVIPEFVIELISPTDDAEQVEKKIVEYFKAGVRVLWKVMPDSQVVYVYTARKIVMICTDNDVCSAASVLLNFGIKAGMLFAPFQVSET
jgi:Uma2 family endonuclease